MIQNHFNPTTRIRDSSSSSSSSSQKSQVRRSRLTERLNSNSRVAFDHQIVIIIIKSKKIDKKPKTKSKKRNKKTQSLTHFSIIALMRGSHCPKGAKDEVKPARRAQSRSLEVGARRASRLLVIHISC